jgi:hypothetical protein
MGIGWVPVVVLLAAPPGPSPAPSPATSPAVSPSPGPEAELEPDISLTATVRWKELRFEQAGTGKVEFTGTDGRKTTWDVERMNLPKPVEPGVTYRDGGVRLTISSRFEDLLRAFASPAPAASPSAVPASPAPSPSPGQRP